METGETEERGAPLDLHPARLLELSGAKRLGRPIYLLDAAGSSNAVAASAAAGGARAGTLFLVEEQTGGKGRKGREWRSVKGKSLTMSLLLRPRRRDEALTAVFALAVARALDRFARPPALKWPNDVFLAGRKLGGILAETTGEAVVIGLGLNVNEEAADFTGDLAGAATSLRAAEGRRFDRGAVLCRILESFEALHDEFERGGFGPLRGEVEKRLLHIGKAVTIESGASRHAGVFLGVTGDGYARVDVGGAERVFPSGDLTLREDSRGNDSRS
ncbi:MAG: biotin--[acetyl-CoA-carboxylase] ligase [Candidatus Latescibacterota bacterium]|jgi:BirA family biotin operon repressor/biotin-[acetyl-CoA-carboxylase] ligase|nr:MAG: biotin--[acetyl-CoA-carboxylase] ligase [Candidatus Latescibacterota bacterium]